MSNTDPTKITRGDNDQNDRKTNNDLRNTTQNTNDWTTRTPQDKRNRRWMQVVRKGKQVPLHYWHPSCNC